MSGRDSAEQPKERQEPDTVLKVSRHRVTREAMSVQEDAEWPRGIGTWDGDEWPGGR